jgi:glucose/arabinose dehydrogenase/cytochrome c2
MKSVITWIGFILIAVNTLALAADVNAGRAAFKQQCAICHSAEPNDNGGAQGPALNGVFGKPAATASAFAYTGALRDSKLVWDANTLNRFLQSPTAVAPGSAMLVAVPDDIERGNLVAYLQSIKDVVSVATPATPASGEAEWRSDAPGRIHRIEVADLPPPFASASVRNAPRLIDRPTGAELSLPPGFKVKVFADKLLAPRRMIVAANGDVLVSEIRGGRISLLHAAKDGSTKQTVFVEGLQQPFGMAFYPDAKRPKWLYVAETHRVVRYPFKLGDQHARGEAQVVVAQLPLRGHITRDIAFSADGKRMFVAVGSLSNVAEDMPKKSADEIKAWEAEHGLGAAWDQETDRAAVLVYEVGSHKPGKTFATGIRNCVSLAIQPKTHDLWCTTNERDLLGDDLVPDYSTRVTEGGFYGWPWYYLGDHEDPRLHGDRPDLARKAIVPDVLYQAHSAALNLTFYTATSGSSAFPADYVGDAIVALHGSWNRSFRTGYKLVRVRMNNGVATGEYQDFLTGFIVDDGNVWGRPVATAVMKDGSLLVSDDAANQIYRVYYAP